MTFSTPYLTIHHTRVQRSMVRYLLVACPVLFPFPKEVPSRAGLAVPSPSTLDSIGSLLTANGLGTGRRGSPTGMLNQPEAQTVLDRSNQV